MRGRLRETVTFTLKLISVFSSNKVKIVLLQLWCLSLPLCKPWAALTWIHGWRRWKRKTLPTLKKIRCLCLNTQQQWLLQLVASTQQPSTAPCSKVGVIFSWDVTRDSVESPDVMVFSGRSSKRLSWPQALHRKLELKQFGTWNSPCLKTAHQHVECSGRCAGGRQSASDPETSACGKPVANSCSRAALWGIYCLTEEHT